MQHRSWVPELQQMLLQNIGGSRPTCTTTDSTSAALAPTTLPPTTGAQHAIGVCHALLSPLGSDTQGRVCQPGGGCAKAVCGPSLQPQCSSAPCTRLGDRKGAASVTDSTPYLLPSSASQAASLATSFPPGIENRGSSCAGNACSRQSSSVSI